MAGFCLAVLNPGGRDPEQDFSAGQGRPGEGAHAPVNFHAYAACTGGRFLRSEAKVTSEPVLLVLRRDLRRARAALRVLKRRGAVVAVTLKEAGIHQVAEMLSASGRMRLFEEILAEAAGAIAPTPEGLALFRGAGMPAGRAAFIPTPYPLEDPLWDFSCPPAGQRGIFVGTREFDVPSRRHVAALFLARRLSEKTGEPVTVMNLDGRRGRKLMELIGFVPGSLTVLDGARPYPEYLRVMARHRIVWQLDRSRVPGQVAGDSLLCRVPCVGGDGAVDRLGFPELHGFGRDDEVLFETALALLRDPGERARHGAASGGETLRPLTFGGAAAALQDFYQSLATG